MTTPHGKIIFYDGACGICTRSTQRWGAIAERRGFVLLPLQGDVARELLHLAPGEIPDEFKLIAADGRVLGGADALLHIARHIWWAWPFWLIGHIPGIHAMLKVIYRIVARNRHRISGTCRLPS